MDAHHDPTDLLGVLEERPDLDPDLAVVPHGRAGRLPHRRGLQRARELRPADAGRRHAVGVGLDSHHPRLPADQLHATRGLDLGELLRQLGGERPQPVARPALAPQREGQERHVVDRVQLDDRRQRALRHDPAHRGLALEHLDQAVLVRLADLEANGHHPHAGARHRVDVLDAGDAPQDPLDRGRRSGSRPRPARRPARPPSRRPSARGSAAPPRAEWRASASAPRPSEAAMIERRELAVEEGVGDPARESDAHGLSPLRRSGPGIARSQWLLQLSHGRAVHEACGVERDALARLDAGSDLDAVAVARADGHPAQAGLGRRSPRRAR